MDVSTETGIVISLDYQEAVHLFSILDGTDDEVEADFKEELLESLDGWLEELE